MDILALINELLAKLADAQTAVDEVAKNKFAEGQASRQAEVDEKSARVTELEAKVAELQAIIDAGNPNPGPTQEQLDQALAQVVALNEQVMASQSRITELENAIVQKDQAMADFKSQELEKVKALEVDFT